MKLSIIIPVYNEAKTIEEVLKKVRAIKLNGKFQKEIIVVNDASIDGTLNILKKQRNIKVFSHKINMGKGSAIKTGIKHSKGDIVVIQDADLEYNPLYIPKLLSTLLKNNAEVVYGSRLKHYPLRLIGAKRTPLITHYIGNKLLTIATRILFKTEITDMETGYKMFRRSVIKDIDIKSKRFEVEPEITAKLLKKGIKIHEVPIKTTPRGYDEGKKITWKDGFVAIWTLVKYKFIY